MSSGKSLPKQPIAPPSELQTEHEVLAWKREYNIRQRDADWRRRQEELLTQKHVAWEIETCERENRLIAARETRKREDLEGRLKARHAHIDNRYKERSRDTAIKKREASWEKKENERLVDMHQTAQEEKSAKEKQQVDRKASKYEELRDEAADRAAKKNAQAEINARREENIARREEVRRKKAAEQAKALKVDDIAHSQQTVTAFSERTLQGDSMIVSVLMQKGVGNT